MQGQASGNKPMVHGGACLVYEERMSSRWRIPAIRLFSLFVSCLRSQTSFLDVQRPRFSCTLPKQVRRELVTPSKRVAHLSICDQPFSPPWVDCLIRMEDRSPFSPTLCLTHIAPLRSRFFRGETSSHINHRINGNTFRLSFIKNYSPFQALNNARGYLI